MAIARVKTLGSRNNGGIQDVAITVTTGGAALGNLVVVRGVQVHDTGVITVTDARSNTYTVPVQYSSLSGDSTKVFVAYSLLTTALQAGDLITVHSDQFAFIDCDAVEFSGTATSSIADGTASGQGNSFGTAWSTPSITTSDAGSLVVSVATWGTQTITNTPGGSFTEESDLGDATSGRHFVTQYRLPGSSGSFTASGTLSGNEAVYAAIAAFKPAGGAAATAPPIRRRRPRGLIIR